MSWLLWFLLLVVCLYVLWRQVRILRAIRDLTHSIRDRRAYLVSSGGNLGISFGIDRLVWVCNELIEENERANQSRQGYVDQINATLGKLREAVLMADHQNEVVLANPACRELLELNGQIRGQRLETVVRNVEFLEYVQVIRRGEEPPHREIEVHLGKTVRWFEVAGALLPAKEPHEAALTLFVLHDITRQKRLERVRTDFVANVSHELRTPVTIIKGYAEMLLDDLEEMRGEEVRRYLEKISRNTSRLHLLLEELLLLSRLEGNDRVLKREPAELHVILDTILENFRLRLPEGTRIETDWQVADDTVPLDSLRFTQVIENMLENTLRHAKGFNRILVTTRPGPGGVWVYLEDNGAGIPPADLPHVFERFYRVDKGRSRESGGTGLGLSIAKHIIMLHGGEIRVESTVGEFTRMGMLLPYAKDAAPTAPDAR